MLTDRRLVLAGTGVLLALPLSARADDVPLARAAAFIRNAGQRLAGLAVDHPDESEKRRRLAAFLDDVVDIGGVARFCLGRFWPAATPVQQQDFVRLFRQVLVIAVAVRVGDYSSGQFRVAINPAVPVGSDIQVPTDILRGDGTQPAHIIWTVNEATGQLRIVDVSAEGVSLRVTQRSDYAAFLRQNNNDIAILLRALHDQVGAG